MRIAEVMEDFRILQLQISQFDANPTPEEYYEIGYEVLRQCRSEAHSILTTHFESGSLHIPGSPGEREKQQLQQYGLNTGPVSLLEMLTICSILLDASARRLQVQKIYLRAMAATRWMHTRAAILQGQNLHAGHMPALQQAEMSLRAVKGYTSSAVRKNRSNQ